MLLVIAKEGMDAHAKIQGVVLKVQESFHTSTEADRGR